MSAKSPISILQEYYMKQGLLPLYTSVEEGGTNAGPFTVKVEVDGRSAVGSGVSKKAAKHNAANAMLKLLKKETNSNDTEAAAPKAPKRPAAQDDAPETEVPLFNRPVRPNFVGKLNECMVKRKSALAKYELVSEDGPPHMRQFTMRCILNDIQEEGTARSKQDAKNIAAEKVYEKLQCDGITDEPTKPKKRKVVDDDGFDASLKKFRSVMDELGGSFSFEEETAKEYAVDSAGNADELAKFDEKDKKMFSFLGKRSMTSLLPEKSSIILNIDTGTDTKTIGARGWTRRDAMFRAISEAVKYFSKHAQKNGDGQQQTDIEA